MLDFWVLEFMKNTFAFYPTSYYKKYSLLRPYLLG
jgi:hypothetical protein